MYIHMFFCCCCFCSYDGAKNFYLLPIMLSVILVFSQERIFNFLKCIPDLWRRTFRILLKYHFLHVPPNTKMSLITALKIKHPPLPAFTLFLCLVISIAIIVRHWLPESEAALFHLSYCKKYHRPSSMWTVEIYFLTVIRAEKSKVKLNADSMTREEPLSGSREDCFQCTPTCQKRGGSLPGLFCKSTLLPWGICLWLNHIHRPHLLIPSP